MKILRIVLGILFLALFVLSNIFLNDKFEGNASLVLYFIEIILAGVALSFFIPYKKRTAMQSRQLERFTKSNIISLIIVFVLIPLTILFGRYFFSDRKYMLISILVILEIFIPFIFFYEKRNTNSRQLIIVAVLCALAVVGRSAFSALPQFKPTLAIVIISAVAFGAENGFLVGAISTFVSNFFFGQGPWTPWQMLAAGVVGFLTGMIFRKTALSRGRMVLSIYGGIVTFAIYGLISNIGSALTFYPDPNLKLIISSVALGVPYDLIHAASTIFFLWFASEPLIEKLERIKSKYGI